jgi:hypothetical protein
MDLKIEPREGAHHIFKGFFLLGEFLCLFGVIPNQRVF